MSNKEMNPIDVTDKDQDNNNIQNHKSVNAFDEYFAGDFDEFD